MQLLVSCVPTQHVTKCALLLIHQKTYNITPKHHSDKECAREKKLSVTAT